MADLNTESEIAKEKRKQRAKERLNSLSGGDLTRGLNSGAKERKVSDTYSTQKAKEKVSAKAKAKSNIENLEQDVKKTKTKNTAKTTKSTAVNPEVFEDDILLQNNKKRKTKKQIGSIVVDESALENITTATTDRRARRNKVIISILVVSILLIWGAVLVMLLVKPKEPKYNCHMYLGGDAASGCELKMNDQSTTKWVAPEGIRAGNVYNLEIELEINKEGTFNVRFRVEVKNDGAIVNNATTLSTPAQFVLEEHDEVEWYVGTNITGASQHLLLSGITFMQDYKDDLLMDIDDENVSIDIYVEIY